MKMWAKCREYKAILKAHKKICHKNQKAGAKKRRKKKLKPFCSESEMKRAIRSEKIIIKKLHGRQWRRWEKDKPELMAKLHLIHKRMLLTWKIHPDKRKFSVDSRFEKEDMPWTDKTE